MFSYLVINLLTIAGPMARSFEPRIAYWRKWPQLFIAIGVTLAVFVAWDSLFTSWGVWGFTSEYLTGIKLINLPIEEWLFFVTVPYACIFIYEVLNYFIRRDLLGNAAVFIGIGLLVLAIGMVIAFPGRLYTQSAFLFLAVLASLYVFGFRQPWTGRFFLSYLVSLIPFFIVNGILTGMVTAQPIVWYDDLENMGLRLGTIPLEDFVYGLDLMWMSLMLYEALLARKHRMVAPKEG